MPSPAVLDIAKLTAPIPGGNPAGTDLRADASPASLYFAIKGARNQARAAERQLAVADEESKDTAPPDWRPLLQNAVKALTEKSKDLEVTAFLIEALVRINGFPGLRDGFRLARELIEKFWDTLFPLPDEEGMETRRSL
jgi:type VI secretion system protein ImpA